MHKPTRQDLYKDFIEFVREESQRERSIVNRRMFNVFLWCFLLPAVISASIMLLVKLNALPRSARGYVDWVALIFPVVYSIYILSSEVLREVPAAFRRGGVATTLGQSLKEGEWRERVCEGLKKAVPASFEDWRWISRSFEIDLESVQYRTRYLTALAGAVFFLIMQGIDSITEPPETERKVTFLKDSVLGWVESMPSNDMTQFLGLALFLVLLYLSGSETHHTLRRYFDCARLMAIGGPDETR